MHSEDVSNWTTAKFDFNGNVIELNAKGPYHVNHFPQTENDSLMEAVVWVFIKNTSSLMFLYG